MVRHSVEFCPALTEGQVDAGSLDPYLAGVNVSDRALGQVLNPYMNNQVAARAMATYLPIGFDRFDNQSLYMKGFFYSLLQAKVVQENVDVAYAPYPADTPIVHIDLAAVGNVEIQMGAALQSNAFILWTGHGFEVAEYPYVLWLASGGRRIIPAAAPHFAAVAVHFPPIPFVIIRSGGVEPPLPGPAPLSPDGMWGFMYKLATNRSERDHLVTGLYEASLLVNSVSMLIHAGEAVPDDVAQRADVDVYGQLYPYRRPEDIPLPHRYAAWYALVTPLLETYGSTVVPEPKDYNALHRLLKITRTEDPAYNADCLAFSNFSWAERLAQTAVLSGFLTICTTTVLHSFGMYGTVIQQIATASPDTSPEAFQIARVDGLFMNVDMQPYTSAVIYMHSFEMMLRHVGGTLPMNVACCRNWNMPRIPWGFAEGPFILTSPHHPPRLGNPLSILAWLDMLPCEWGISDSKVQADFKVETVQQGPIGARGWRAARGEPLYQEHSVGREAFYTCIPYGALAMNVISQALHSVLPPGPVAYSWEVRAWDTSGLTGVELTPVHPHPPVWMPEHWAFEPCTVITFDWATYRSYAPMLTEANSNLATIYILYSTPLTEGYSKGYMITADIPYDPESYGNLKPVAGLKVDRSRMRPAIVTTDAKQSIPPSIQKAKPPVEHQIPSLYGPN
jgi:hypothetical protein